MKRLLIMVGVIAIAAGCIWAGLAWNTLRVNAKATQLNQDMDTLFYALQKYKERVGTYPIGGNLEVVKALAGNNKKNVIVVLGNRITVNEKGEFIDSWGTPLRIYISDSGVLIRSAGPNRRFDDSTVIGGDDYYRSN